MLVTKNHCQLASYWLFWSLIFVSILNSSFFFITNTWFYNPVDFTNIIIIKMVVIFDLCFFFLLFCWKKFPYPYLNYYFTKIRTKNIIISFFKKWLFWIIILPILLNIIFLIICFSFIYYFYYSFLTSATLIVFFSTMFLATMMQISYLMMVNKKD